MPEKRADRVADIKARMESSAYNVGQYKKNFKNLDEKVAFFVNKDAVGELKPFMRPRLEEAEKTLRRLEELHGKAYASSLAAKPVKATATKAKATATKAKATTVKANKVANTVPATVAAANTLSNSLSKMNISSPRPVLGNNGKALTIKSRRKANTSAKPKTLRAPRNVTINEYMEKAFAETQKKVPELYNPFTGVKYGPTESPMDDIEKAYIILRKIRTNTISRARVLRTRASKAKAKTQKANNKNKNKKNNSKPRLSTIAEVNEESNTNSPNVLEASAVNAKPVGFSSPNSSNSSSSSSSSSNSNSSSNGSVRSASGLQNF